MSPRLASAAAAAGLVWFAAAAGAAQSARRATLVAGAPAPDRGAVVALLDDAGQVVCSGVLVRPQVVLTAAHCVDDGRGLPAFVDDGPDLVRSAGARVRVRVRLPHPAFSRAGLRADLALLGIGAGLAAAPLPLWEGSSGEALLGREVEVLGYGCSDPAGELGVGVRRAQRDWVQAIVEGPKLRHGESTCRGDSGGPLVLEGSVLAISSSGGDDGAAFALATPVGPYRAWIDAEAAALQDLTARARPAPGGCTASGSGGSALSLLLCLAAALRRCDTRRFS